MAKKFRQYRVARKIRESEIITSFELEPTDGEALAPALPGQYLPLRIPGPDGATLRNYSLSCNVASPERYRVTIKREAAPANLPDAPHGIASCYMHDQVSEGDEITAMAPRGVFYLDQDSTRPVVLLSGGVGLTPMVSMLHSLAGTDRPVWFIHACENGAVHALRDEVLELGQAENATVHFAYRVPHEADHANGHFHSEGVITRETLQSLLPLDDYEVYMCGPTPFMRAMYQLLQTLGLDKERINYEFFGPSDSLDAPSAPIAEAPATEPAPQPAKATGENTVTFAKSGITVDWDDSAESLLDLAEKAGLEPEFSCRTGICNTCLCNISDGEVDYFEDPLDDPDPGEVLLCCSRPKSAVILDL
ncbi:2Fe-2S iron-sulfur cluster-binding protein [Ruegeria sp.]|uniref:2Fe-2S iron-sulfur cluster-binding protein n=1 Tax=Ruegeria sp. TaxID=1879320 RepID=UPI003C7CE8ED